MTNITELVEWFIDMYGVKVAEEEDLATTELYMDNHDCIVWNNQEYYIAQDNSSYTEQDNLLRQMIVNTFCTG